MEMLNVNRLRSLFWRALLLIGLSASQLLAQAPSGGEAEAGPPPQPLPHPELPEVPMPPSVIPLWIWLVVGAVIVALLALVLILLFGRPKKAKLHDPVRPRRQALEALATLRQKACDLSPASVAGQVSSILRTYIEQRYQIPARYRTTPELFSDAAPLPVTPAAPKDPDLLFAPSSPTPPRSPLIPFAPLAQLWDRLAFAPVPATPDDALSLIDTARDRIQEDPA